MSAPHPAPAFDAARGARARALLSPAIPKEGPQPSNPLTRGALARRVAWLAATDRRVWTFDRSAAYAAAIRVLVAPGGSALDGYLAAGVLLDLVEGRPPNATLPPSWRSLPDEVRTVLGLPGTIHLWTRGALVAGVEIEQARAASVIAAACEADGDEAGRAMFAEAARRRLGARTHGVDCDGAP